MPRIRARTLFASFRYAIEGLGYALLTQRNMRIHVVMAIGITTTAILLHLPTRDIAVLLLTAMIVIVSEMINTAIESAIDLFQRKRHPLAKIAKDVAAGAVFISAVGATAIGLLILGPPLWAEFGVKVLK